MGQLYMAPGDSATEFRWSSSEELARGLPTATLKSQQINTLKTTNISHTIQTKERN